MVRQLDLEEGIERPDQLCLFGVEVGAVDCQSLMTVLAQDQQTRPKLLHLFTGVGQAQSIKDVRGM